MDWKEFFRPNKAKVIILIVLIIISVVSISGKMVTRMCITGPCGQPFPFDNEVVAFVNDVLIFPIILLTGMDNPINIRASEAVGFAIGSIITLIYQYTLSCIIQYSRSINRKFKIAIGIILLFIIVIGTASYLFSPPKSDRMPATTICGINEYGYMISQQIKEDLRTSGKIISFPSQRISLEKDEKKTTIFGLFNPEETRDYDINVYVEECRGIENCTLENCGVEFDYNRTTMTFSKEEAKIMCLDITASRNDTCLVRISVKSNQEEIANRHFFVQVIG